MSSFSLWLVTVKASQGDGLSVDPHPWPSRARLRPEGQTLSPAPFPVFIKTTLTGTVSDKQMGGEKAIGLKGWCVLYPSCYTLMMLRSATFSQSVMGKEMSWTDYWGGCGKSQKEEKNICDRSCIQILTLLFLPGWQWTSGYALRLSRQQCMLNHSVVSHSLRPHGL